MSDLFDSRCHDCGKKAYQCTPCAIKDKTIKKDARLAKRAAKPSSPVRLFSETLVAPAVLSPAALSVVSHAPDVLSPAAEALSATTPMATLPHRHVSHMPIVQNLFTTPHCRSSSLVCFPSRLMLLPSRLMLRLCCLRLLLPSITPIMFSLLWVLPHRCPCTGKPFGSALG